MHPSPFFHASPFVSCVVCVSFLVSFRTDSAAKKAFFVFSPPLFLSPHHRESPPTLHTPTPEHGRTNITNERGVHFHRAACHSQQHGTRPADPPAITTATRRARCRALPELRRRSLHHHKVSRSPHQHSDRRVVRTRPKISDRPAPPTPLPSRPGQC